MEFRAVALPSLQSVRIVLQELCDTQRLWTMAVTLGTVSLMTDTKDQQNISCLLCVTSVVGYMYSIYEVSQTINLFCRLLI